MKLLILSTLILLLSFLDSEFTKRRIFEQGIEIELNPLVKFLYNLGLKQYGVDIGVVIPSMGLIALGLYFNGVLWFVLGCKFTLFLFQQRSQFNGNNP